MTSYRPDCADAKKRTAAYRGTVTSYRPDGADAKKRTVANGETDCDSRLTELEHVHEEWFTFNDTCSRTSTTTLLCV